MSAPVCGTCGGAGEIDGRGGTHDPPRVDCPECVTVVTLPRDMTVEEAVSYAVAQVLPPQITVTRLTVGGVDVLLPDTRPGTVEDRSGSPFARRQA